MRKGMPVVPPEEAVRNDEMRRAMGPHAPRHASQPIPPRPEPTVVYKDPTRKTVSVRIGPHHIDRLAVVARSIGWTPNRIMTVLVESGAAGLVEAYAEGGSGAAIQHLEELMERSLADE